MAAVKLHLKNNNKDYKLKATDRKTDAGKIIYKNTLTGELHSELSMTLEMPEGSGNWINVPSLINGRVYNRQGVIDMLNAGKVEPTSTGHLTQDAAVQAAIYRSNNLQQLPATKEDIIGADIKPNQVVSLSDAVNSWNSSGVQDTYVAANTEKPATFEVDIRDEDMMRKFDNATQYSPPIRGFDYKAADDFLTSTGTTARINAHMNANQAELIDNRTFGEKFQDGMSKIAGGAEMSYPGPSQAEIEAKRQNDLIESIANKSDLEAYYAQQRKNLQDNKALQGVMEQLEEAKGMNIDAAGHSLGINIHKGEPVPSNTPITERAKTKAFPGREDSRFDANGGYLNTPTDDGIFNYRGLKLNPANQPVAEDEQVYGGGNYNLQPNDDGSFDYGDVPGKSRMRDDGPFDYTGVPLNPKNQRIVREVVNVPKNVKPDYGEMPGFKFHQAEGQKAGQGYWSADETSDFWQTDAGYDKAMQTWGQKPGWVKPGYRPKKKELDIDAIKKWFKPNK